MTTIEYRVYGCDAQGRAIPDEEHEGVTVEDCVTTVEDAYTRAKTFLDSDARIHHVTICEFLQHEPGSSWQSGEHIDHIYREPVVFNVLTPVIAMLSATCRRDAIAAHAAYLNSVGQVIYTDDRWTADAFISDDQS